MVRQDTEGTSGPNPTVTYLEVFLCIFFALLINIVGLCLLPFNVFRFSALRPKYTYIYCVLDLKQQITEKLKFCHYLLTLLALMLFQIFNFIILNLNWSVHHKDINHMV